ncbi:hypothetical protein SIL77_00155 [Exiguobacterium profundum]|uniref:hypothetical protein n=1 Tax=Exiguobacterium profundum TaxID=307643 RepID=UPI0029C596E4|nr:hypothetical protein [Exiguobacterium profundum]MDX5979684.1 hypothetical protein [Exiguobacterium profundum]
MNKITMYSITKSILLQQDSTLTEENIKSTDIVSESNKHRKQFKKMVEALDLDPAIFKSENEKKEFSFKETSEETIIELLTDYGSEYREFKKDYHSRDFEKINQFVKLMQRLISNEFEGNSQKVNEYLSIIEWKTLRDSQFLDNLINLFIKPIGFEGLSMADVRVLNQYYLERLKDVAEEYQYVRETFADIRYEEILEMYPAEIDEDEERMQIDPLIIEAVLNPTNRKEMIMKEQLLKDVRHEFNLSNKEAVLSELRKWKESNYQESDYFLFPSPKVEIDLDKLRNPSEVLEEAVGYLKTK